jgi:hypothetical protein
MNTISLAPEPKATSKHTLCGYAWGDVQSALLRAIANGDMARAQRWGAELVCSEQGLGRLEAALLHAWAVHVGPAYPGWCNMWFSAINLIRTLWSRSGGDTKAIRNTPTVRQVVAEAIAALVLAGKKPLPTLPTAADCFKEAEGMRMRLKAGGGVSDQVVVRRIWAAANDGGDLKTIGNELEAALRANQTPRVLFWIVWFFTLDQQTDAPQAKERGPSSLSVKARKSLLWFLVAMLRELANDSAFLSTEERGALFGALELTWSKLGSKGRKETVIAIALCIQEHMVRRSGGMMLAAPASIPSLGAIRDAVTMIDVMYSSIGEEARRFMLEQPKLGGIAGTIPEPQRVRLSSNDKLALAYSAR